MKDKTAAAMSEAVTQALGGLPPELRTTVTYDNGLENALRDSTNLGLGVKPFFRKPYHSWEKGSSENRGGVSRRYFPQKHNWRLTTRKSIDKAVRKINATPVKCLGFKTPAEVFAKCGGVALAS
jgi:IS30 family transposase